MKKQKNISFILILILCLMTSSSFHIGGTTLAADASSPQVIYTNNDRGLLYAKSQPYSYDAEKFYLNEQQDYIIYKFSNGRLEILKWVGHGESTLTIPDVINGKKVNKVFIQEDLGVKNIILGDGIKQFEFDDIDEDSGIDGFPRSDEFSSIETFTLGTSFEGSPVCLSEGIFDSLKEIKVVSTNKKIKSIDGVLFSKNGNKLLLYPASKGETYVVPKGTEIINDHAFERVSSLKKVVFKKGLKKIKKYAFASCKNLTSITFPASVAKIGAGAFYDCRKLKKVVVKGKKTQLTARSEIHISDNRELLREARILKDVKIKAPKGSVAQSFAKQVKKLNKLKKQKKQKTDEFANLSKSLRLSSVITSSVKTQAKQEDEEYTQKLSLETYYPDEANKEKYFTYFLVKDPYLKGYNSLFITELSDNFGKELYVPDVINGTDITDVFLAEFDSLDDVHLGNQIHNIFCMYPETYLDGTLSKFYDAFPKYESIMDNEDRKILTEAAKQKEQKNTIKKLTVGENFQVDCLTNYSLETSGQGNYEGLPHIYKYTLIWSCNYETNWITSGFTSLEQIIVADDNKNLSADEFGLYTKGFKTLLYVFPPQLKNLTTFTPRSECTAIQAKFTDADNLEKVVLHDSIISIGDSAFAGCTKLTSLTLGNGLVKIGDSAFKNTGVVGTLNFPGALQSIGDQAFQKTNIEGVSFENCPDVMLGVEVFKKCKKLISVILPTNLRMLNYGMFAQSSAIETINLPESLERICPRAFKDCQSLCEFIAPKNLKKIGQYAFLGCTNLETVKLSQKIRAIKRATFSDCSSLKEITLPKSVKKVSYTAFNNCYELDKIVVKGTIKKVWP